MENYSEFINRYDYAVPKELIATRPEEPRENARLLTYRKKTGEISLGHFYDLPQILGPKMVLVFNETRVIPARITGTLSTGGKVEITVVGIQDLFIKTLSSRRVDEGAEVMVGEEVFVARKREKQFTYYTTRMKADEVRSFLDAHGEAPLPPYIKDTPLSSEEAKALYQTVFARNDGSVAAPTASLHFSEKLMTELKVRGVQIEFVTLHVGLGTFLPVTEKHIAEGKLHEEEYFIDSETADRINEARRSGKKIIPVGTTSLRTLESAADESGLLTHLSGATRLFIRPGYKFKVTDGLITNFHVPKSSLLMLVDAFLGDEEKWRRVYETAMRNQLRFFSFGDGMLVL